MVVIVFIYGLLFGSFFNVCIYRIPAGVSIVHPRSHCGSCQHSLNWKDLIPIISYMWLGAKCRYCKAHIAIRYPLVELLTGLLFLWTYLQFGFTITFAKNLILVSLLIILSFIDWDHHIIPDRINLSIGILGLISLFAWPELTLLQGLYGFLLGGGSLYFIAIVTNAMGGGDIKLMAAAGLYLGLTKTIVALYAGFIIGGVVSLFLLMLKIKGRKDPIAFGPYLSIGILLAAFYGKQIIAYYFSYLGITQ